MVFAVVSFYLFNRRQRALVQQGIPIIKGTHEISNFDLEALISAIRSNQEGLCTFLEFLFATGPLIRS